VCTELRRLGAGDPEAQAADLVSISDGVVFDRLVGVRSIVVPAPGTAESVEELGAPSAAIDADFRVLTAGAAPTRRERCAGSPGLCRWHRSC